MRVFRKGAPIFLLLFPLAARTQPVQHTTGSGDVVPPTRLSTETVKAPEKSSTPWPVRLMLHPVRRGMIVSLPIIDTNPNRGVTLGAMPIAVITEKEGSRIEQIHAPSITYNKNFLWIATYRYYYYPAADKSLTARAEFSKFEHEGMGQYEDKSFLGTTLDFKGRLQYNIDSGARFYGFGPAANSRDESNYRADYYLYTATLGHPVLPETAFRAHVTDRLLGERIANGPVPGLTSFDSLFGTLAPVHYQQTNELRLTLDYDTRNHPFTTRTGHLVQAFYEHSSRGFASQYDYSRYGCDVREFHPWASDDRFVTAAQVRYEQLLGNAPFWLLPSLGGKYSLRAYGEGRFIDRGAFSANVEERYTFFKKKVAGVTTEFELAPFAGFGTVFDNPRTAMVKYVRPVLGAAIRAVARPQVVGSVDLAVGQEGLKVFMDINYAF